MMRLYDASSLHFRFASLHAILRCLFFFIYFHFAAVIIFMPALFSDLLASMF